jgi:hypothetical protein
LEFATRTSCPAALNLRARVPPILPVQDLFDTVPQDVQVVDTGNYYYPGMRDPRIAEIDAEMPRSV